tara:strand:- start:8835 stop:9053 length:219 start_codon:yes stop_codon:yes gene_type:complete
MALVHIEILKKEVQWLYDNPNTIHRHPRKTVIAYLNQRILSLEQEQEEIKLAKETLRATKKATKKDDVEKSS